MPNTPPKKNSGKRWPFARRKKSPNAPKNNYNPRLKDRLIKDLHKKIAFAERSANITRRQAVALREVGLNTLAAEANRNKEEAHRRIAKLRSQLNSLRNKGTWTAHPVSLQGRTLTIDPNELEWDAGYDQRYQRRLHFLEAKRANTKAKAKLANAKRTASRIKLRHMNEFALRTFLNNGLGSAQNRQLAESLLLNKAFQANSLRTPPRKSTMSVADKLRRMNAYQLRNFINTGSGTAQNRQLAESLLLNKAFEANASLNNQRQHRVKTIGRLYR